MRRLLILIIALLSLSGVFAQQKVDLEAQKPQHVIVNLAGPPACQQLPLDFEVTYQPDKELIKLELRAQFRDEHIGYPKKKDQITHIWFPIAWDELQYKDIKINFKSYFKNQYVSKVVLEAPMRKQITYCKSSDFIKPAFEITNGELQNPNKEGILLPLQGNQKIVFEIKVSNIDEPVVLKINNVIPVRAKQNYLLNQYKYFLKYISDNHTITFNIPEDDCSGQWAYIEKYEQWNSDLKKDVSAMYKFQADPKNEKKEIIRNKLHLLNKYEDARKGISATYCERLQQEFDNFHDYYIKIAEGVVTPDSLQKMIRELDTLYNDAFTARNYGKGKSCKELKKKAEKFNDVELDEEAYKGFPEAYDLVIMFKDRIKEINDIKCPGGGGKPVKTTPPSPANNTRCNVDVEKINRATDEINDLLTKLWEGKKLDVNDKKKFNAIVAETDSYLQSLSEPCKNDSRYKTAIKQYRDAKASCSKRVK